MYGLLSTSPSGTLTARYPLLDNFEIGVQELDDAEQKSRALRLLTVLTSAFPDVNAKGAAYMALRPAWQAAWPYIAGGDLDYAVNMAVAFYKRHGASYAAAQQAIAREVDAQFPPSNVPVVVAVTQRMKALGFLLPEGQRGLIFDVYCSERRVEFYYQNVLPSPWSEAVKTIDQAVSGMPQRQGDLVFSVASDAVVAAPSAEVVNVLNAVDNLIKATRWDVFPLLRNEAEIGGAALKHRILRTAVCGVVDHLDDVADYVAEVGTMVRLQNEACVEKCFDDTMAAIDSGVDFGEYTEANRDALNARLARLQDIATRQIRTLTAAARTRRAGPKPAQPAKAQPSPTSSSWSRDPDPETLRTWSLKELVRWIEGPVAGPGSKPLDVKAVVARSRPSQPRPQPQPAQAQASAEVEVEVEDDTLTEDDVHTIGGDGYAAAAEFLLAEINDLISVGKQLHADDAALQACAHLTAPLAQLAKEPADLQQAWELLTQAERDIAQLRACIRVSQASVQLQERFFVQLQGALANETLSPGRRDGGQINCPLKIDDWGWVVQSYHQRLLAGTRVVVVNDQEVRLNMDQALALYVTGSSQSNYPFDVTVHLWQRYAGNTLPPGRPLGPNDRLPLMNADGWYDTFTTCCVLHAQAAPH